MVIDVKGVTVAYRTGDFTQIGLKEYVVRKIKRNLKTTKFIALDNISFTLEDGDLLGIIGTNGAGKSTLLKVITGILPPIKGTVNVNGKIAALLELASGFDPDLTVKENVFLRGAMLGYTREFITSKYPEILEYSELEEYEDRAFKQLSSGMKSRLAFSIACLVEPEILILDEVLSVGDGAFRKKSEAKMKEIMKSGCCTLFVSHSLTQVRRLCNKVLWLDKGKQIAFGDAKTVCDKYDKYLMTVANMQKKK
ncbi:MAG: ABC transporter ATP-binding protein [Ruminiclostridium sp.]|nr:ABC transporter ATP-binding protein [Ruminiclostridium sp.]